MPDAGTARQAWRGRTRVELESDHALAGQLGHAWDSRYLAYEIVALWPTSAA